MTTITLPFPHKLLWPNGSNGSPGAVRAQRRRHKEWAYYAALKRVPRCFQHNGETIPVRLTVHAKSRGPLPDRDNCVAALKAYQDGIAAAMKVDDKHFAEPVVEFAEPRDGRFVVTIGETGE